MENNGVVVNGNGMGQEQEPTNGIPAVKTSLKTRLMVKAYAFRANHPVICKAGKWLGRAGLIAGGAIIGRKTVKPTTVYVTPIPADTTEEPAESTEPSEEPAAEENNE